MQKNSKIYVSPLISCVLTLIVILSQALPIPSAAYGRMDEKNVLGQNSLARDYMPPNPEAYPEFYKDSEAPYASQETETGVTDSTQNPDAIYTVEPDATEGIPFHSFLNSSKFSPGMDLVSQMSAPLSSGSAEKVLVIPITFTNESFDPGYDTSHYEDLMSQMKAYYENNSDYLSGVRGITIDATVIEPVNSHNTMEFYGQDTTGGAIDYEHPVEELAIEALQLLKEKNFDFTPYDRDDDGVIDHLLLIHAGKGQEEIADSNLIWSCSSALELDGGKIVQNFTVIPENGALGVCAHEFGHDLGLPDLYDTDGNTNGYTLGVGDWDLMGSGSWNHLPGEAAGTCPSNLSAWSKMYLGWLNPTNVSTNGTYTLTNIDGNYQAYKIWTNGNSSGNEYYLAEYRRKKGFDAALPGEGVLIWHIDSQKINATIDANRINSNSSRLGVELEQSDGSYDLRRKYNSGDSRDPFSGTSKNKNFTTVPYYLNRSNIDGTYSYVDILSIEASGETATAYYSMTKTYPATGPALLAPVDESTEDLQPTFAWGVVHSGMLYCLQIAENEAFTQNLTEYDLDELNDGLLYSGTGFSYTIPSAQKLTAGKTYYWRVAAKNSLSSDENVTWTPPRILHAKQIIDITPAISFSFDGTNAGRLMGSDSTMEYSLDGGTSYTNVSEINQILTDSELDSTSAENDIKVRLTATETEFAGPVKTIDILFGSMPLVWPDDSNNVIVGIDNSMEFSTNGSIWTRYESNLPNLNGDIEVRVRNARTGVTLAGTPAILLFTAAIPSYGGGGGGGGGTEEPGGGTEEPGGGTEEPGSGTSEPGGGTEEPGGGTSEIGGGTEEPSGETVEPGSGTVEPGGGAGGGAGGGGAGSGSAEIQLNGMPVINNGKIAKTSISEESFTDAMKNAKKDAEGAFGLTINIPKVNGAEGYSVSMPSDLLVANENRTGAVIEINSAVGIAVLPDNMISQNDAQLFGKNVELIMKSGDKSQLPADLQSEIGNHPILDIHFTVNGQSTAWENPDAPVTLSVLYRPTLEEWEHPENIVVWYIDGSGKAIKVPSGKYDQATGRVTFTVTHFSQYSVGFYKSQIKDLGSYAWAEKEIDSMVGRGIIKEKTGTTFEPGSNVTRAEFLYGMIHAMGLTGTGESCFDDIAVTDYYYQEIALAKELGITNGDGNNQFNPNAAITRQDMMTLMARALKLTGNLETNNEVISLNQFADYQVIALYAKDSIIKVVSAGIIKGDGKNINPLSNTTRAEAAVILYRIYNR